MAYAIGSATGGGVLMSDGTVSYQSVSNPATGWSYTNYPTSQPSAPPPPNTGNAPAGDPNAGNEWDKRGISQDEWMTHLANVQRDEEAKIGPQIDAAYNPAYERLNNLEADYRREFPTAQAEIEQSFNALTPQLESEQSAKLQGVEEQKQAAGKAKKSQFQTARQIYNEMSQGGLTRFGGASSTGGAYSELLGRQAQQDFSGIQQNYGDTMQNLTKETANVNAYFANKKTALEEEKQLKLRQLKDNFDRKIEDINTDRKALDSEKAAKRLAALQSLSAEIRSLQADYQEKNQLLSEWKSYKDEVLATAREFNAKSFTLPDYNNQFGNVKIVAGNTGSNYSNAQGYYTGEGDSDLEKYGYFRDPVSNKLYQINTDRSLMDEIEGLG